MIKKINRLYIIGAGASCPYGLPTLKTLLWDLCEFVVEEERQILKQAIYEACGVDLERPEDSPDFEEFLNRLDAHSLLYLRRDKLEILSALRPRAAVVALKGLRNFISQKSQASANQKGPYDHLVKSLRDDHAIVSFNWDVLLEVAFRHLNRKYSYLSTKSSKDSTLLLRPHGCISWHALLDRELISIDLTANVGVFGDNLTYYMLYLKDPLGPLDMGKSSPIAKSSVSPLAAIVPPMSSMAISVGGPTHNHWVDEGHLRAMRAVWTSFKIIVRRAKDIVVIGYSLPGTDLAAIEVMKEFGASNAKHKSSKRLLIVDKDKSILERYRRIAFPDAELICDDFRKFNPETL